MLLLTLCLISASSVPKRIPQEEARGINANPSSWVGTRAVPWTEEARLLGRSRRQKSGGSGGGNGGQLLKQLNWDRGAFIEGRDLKCCSHFWGRHSALTHCRVGRRGLELPSHE